MKRLVIISMALALASGSIAQAKRSAPKDVPSVTSGKIEYRAPKGQMGCIEAWQGKDLIWRRQVYVVKYDIDLERDVQDVFIQKISLKGDILTIKNERGSVYELNLDTLAVKVVKGSLVEDRK